METIPLGKWGDGANRMKEICALHKSEFMRHIDERRLLIICYAQVPSWAKGKMIPINGEIFPISKGNSYEELKIRCQLFALEFFNLGQRPHFPSGIVSKRRSLINHPKATE